MGQREMHSTTGRREKIRFKKRGWRERRNKPSSPPCTFTTPSP